MYGIYPNFASSGPEFVFPKIFCSRTRSLVGCSLLGFRRFRFNREDAKLPKDFDVARDGPHVEPNFIGYHFLGDPGPFEIPVGLGEIEDMEDCELHLERKIASILAMIEHR